MRERDRYSAYTYVLIFFVCNVINALNNVSSISRDFAFIWQLVSVRTGERETERQRETVIYVYGYMSAYSGIDFAYCLAQFITQLHNFR